MKTKTQPITLVFDGQELKLPEGQYSFIYQGRTYVPIRYISYALLKMVAWDGKKATVSEPTAKQLEALKKHLLSAADGGAKPQTGVTISLKPVKAALVFDGVAKTLPAGQTLFNYNGSIYVPLRFLAESVGTEIGWDPATKTVSGESAAYRAEQGNGGETDPEPGEGTDGTDDGGTAENGGAAGGAGPGAGAGAGGGVVGGGGGGAVEPTYEQITSAAKSSLEALRASCQATLMDLAIDYLGAKDADKPGIKANAKQEMASCTARFEAILSDTTAKLEAGGYSTAIIAEYRAAFEAELKAGQAIADSLG
ncbi:copper amine oxidase N-terminal domain-containing protein [Paenibacillus sp. N4]|uniref:copper amine oxidase N-terminal domain-containing protein n=1 Tax=Paenibacillus vietnamensis TaxID=2590547 RepID=UPI001CD0FDDE|nr:copper amine oxidase N-terminal domain-containing protein [Paenibacillus vietnamensis]MCA0756482.1 copper amine oxidase N-terminal domain-containing protein [Paenibacillus vietnamensis]